MPNKMMRWGFIPLQLVFDAWDILEFPNETMDVFGKQVKITSLRMRTFLHHGVICKCCGLKASYFACERPIFEQESFPYHLNLYSFNADNSETLFTHDHIVPRSKNGKNTLSNTQTLCLPCNQAKGDTV